MDLLKNIFVNPADYKDYTAYIYVRHRPSAIDPTKPINELYEDAMSFKVINGVYILLVPNNKPRPRFRPDAFTRIVEGTYILAPLYMDMAGNMSDEVANKIASLAYPTAPRGNRTFLLAVDHIVQLDKIVSLARHLGKSNLRSNFYCVGNGKLLVHCDDTVSAFDIGKVVHEYLPCEYVIAQIDPLGLDYVMPTMLDDIMGHALHQIITDPDYTLPEHISVRKK